MIPIRGRIIFFFGHHPQTGSEAYTESCRLGTTRTFPEGKVTCAEVEDAWVDLYLHSPLQFHDLALKLKISFAEGSVSGGNLNGA